MSLTKQLIRHSLVKLGFDIAKYPSSQFSCLPVFDICVQLLMSVKGNALTFIQVGANDGCFEDPLRKYILNFPWRGVLVEPQPVVFEKLRANYESVKDRLIFENIAIAPEATEISMYRASKRHEGDRTFADTVASISPKVTARQLGLRQPELEAFTVSCSTLDGLIAKYDIHQLDVLQIDVEGEDFNVLKTLDFARTCPLIIQFEHGHLSPRDVNNVVQHLNARDYQILYGGRQIDTIAVHKTFPLMTARD